MGYDLVPTNVIQKDDKGENVEWACYGESNISKFYAGKTIFITGSTGFIGKIIVEKLLRGCPQIKRIYLLLRPKREIGVADRLKKYFDDPLFETVLSMNPKVSQKIKVIGGNLMEPDIGLTPEDRHILTTETDLIIHNAAITNFFMKINVVLKVNVLGVKALLDLACDCKRLTTFLLVSTAYSQSYMRTLDDQVYPMDVDLKTIYDVIKADVENVNGLSTEAVKSVIGQWPNVYTFTKAFGEVLVDEYSKRSDFQCCIFRPSIVMCTCKEPVEGWMKSKGGYAMSILATGVGLLRTIHINFDATADVIPADLCVNNMLAIPWYTNVYRKDVKGEAMVFNCGTSVCHPLKAVSCIRGVVECIRENPSSKAFWYNDIYMTRYYTIFQILVILLHVIPSLIVDLVLFLQRKKPFVTSTIRRYTSSIIAVLYFQNKNMQIHVPNLKKMWECLNETDRELFLCDLRTVDWHTYYRVSWESTKKYLLLEPVQATNETKRRFFRLKMLHYSLLCFVTLMLAIFFYRLLY